jgi:dipeptidyl aminopeptidase/acylaminoacyl peptidase
MTTAVRGEREETLRGLVAEDIPHFRWLEEMAIRPDGAHAAYTVRRANETFDGYLSDVFVARLDANVMTARESVMTSRLTQEDGTASSLAWSRDGRLAFVWRPAPSGASPGSATSAGAASTAPEIQICSAEGVLLQRIACEGGDAPSQLTWSPDGRRLACVRWVRQVDDDPYSAGPLRGLKPTVRVIRRLRYKQDGPGFVHDRFKHVFVVDVTTGQFQAVTDGECDYDEPAWSRSGHALAFVAHAREQEVELGQGQIFVCEWPGGTPRRLLPSWIGSCRSPQWGPDDRSIAFAAHTAAAPTNRRVFHHVWIADVATGEARDLTAELDQTVGNYAVADQRAGLTNITVRWPGGSPYIYFLATVAGAVHLFRVSAAGGPVEKLAGGDNVIFEYAPAGTHRVVYGLADPRRIGELHVWEGGVSRQLTDLNPWLRSRRLSAPESYHYNGLDGEPVHAWILKPVNFEEGKRYPTILYVHCSMFSWDFNHEIQTYANAGFVVAYFNQRGTTAGYGQEWTICSQGDQGGRDYEEIMVGVDDLVRRPYVDASRLGVTGGSCGGFMTNWIVGHTNRFKAAVTQRSISNYVSKFGTSDIGPEGTLRETGATPWDDLDKIWMQSPIAYAKNIHTPLLILHSDEDHRCPIEQAEQLFAILRWLGRDVEFVWFVGENHGLSRGGRPVNRIERLRRILGWFEKHLGTRSVPA